MSDAEGKFAIPGCRVGENFVTATAAGFTPTTLTTAAGPEAAPVRLVLAAGKTLRLRVTNSAGEPVAGANVWYDTFDREAEGNPPRPSVQAEFSPVTDPEGRFVFPQVPPFRLRLARTISAPSEPGPTGFRYMPVPVFAPGETLRLDVGKTDRQVTLRIRLPEGEREPIRFAGIITLFPLPSAEILADPEKALAWRRQPEVVAAMASSGGFGLESNTDGSWKSEAVTPGQYVLRVALGSAVPSPDHPPRVFQAPITIPEGPAEQGVDLGEVQPVP